MEGYLAISTKSTKCTFDSATSLLEFPPADTLAHMKCINNLIYFLKIFIYFIYLFLAALGLRCCMRASCGERGLLFIEVRRLLIAVASLGCGAWAVGTWASVVVARRLQ